MEFPRLVYKGPATHVLVANEAEHAKAIAAGWFNTVPEVMGQKPAVIAPKQAGKVEDLGNQPAPTAVVADPVPATTAPAKKLTKKEEKEMAKVQQAAAASQASADAAPGAATKMPWD